MSKQLGLASPVTGGSVDEMLLARLEQQNSELRKDPKNRVLQNLQREAVRRSVENLKHDKANKGIDGEGEYDWEFWALCLSNFQHITRSQSRVLATNIQRGIPPSLRGMIWQMFSKSKDPVLESQYRDLLRRDSPYDKMIQRDLARTFPDHQFFKDPEGQGQTGLYNVVKAYSIYDEEVGYCQGIAFIVGALLLNMPDEEAFCVLTCLMKQYGLRGHYTPDMEGLQLHLYQYEKILSEQLPHIYRHLELKGISSTMYASQWFMTLFAYRFPLEVVFRIYDIMLSEGVESIIRFAIALLKKNEKTILSLEFEALLSYLKNDLFNDYETQQLVEDACAINITARRIDQLTKEHRNSVIKEQLEKEAIEELQKSNSDISQTIQQLEQRLKTMFQEHDDVLTQLDESKKQLRHLTSENERMRRHVSSLKETVDLLPQEVEAMSRDEFEVLCTENATLIEKNCSLEDQLNAAESLLIDMKVKYAESENETDSLRRHLNEMRKIMAV
ncbi:rab-GTPase-TBC domain-containing protein [Umbelopsis sp. PMI_123]|nr:rab-GTPase-TBC domain-containing protein [Umbelopsis sp. PMI_123]